jgi:hypothetical protein
MRRGKFGETLRMMALTVPLLRGTASCCSKETFFLSLQLADGGVLDVGPTCTAFCESPPDSLCSYPVEECSFVTLDGGPGVSCTISSCGHQCTGRRPASLLASSPSHAASPVGAYLADAARLEGASVVAFQVLANELRMLGAPEPMIRAARRSGLEEVRHTEITSAMARRYGAEPLRPIVGAPPPPRSLETIAIENAVEGCARETYGAMVAWWQAHHAQDPLVATAMAEIAGDETRHAELAWEVAAWANSRLSTTARREVVSAHTRAIEDLTIEVARPVDPDLAALAGLPEAETAAALLRSLQESGPAIDLTGERPSRV